MIRIVKMTFVPEHIDRFKKLFEDRKEKIASFEGCSFLSLVQHQQEKHIFFTISEWESEEYLEVYRQSELFQDTWKQTKSLFYQKAEAWSVDTLFQSKALFG